MSFILIHREKSSDLDKIYNILMKDLFRKYSGSVIWRHTGTVIEIGNICIEFRFGACEKMAGIRPHYFNTDSQETSEFINMSACKINGREVKESELFETIDYEIRKGEKE